MPTSLSTPARRVGTDVVVAEAIDCVEMTNGIRGEIPLLPENEKIFEFHWSICRRALADGSSSRTGG
jgi:hypothetical protein